VGSVRTARDRFATLGSRIDALGSRIERLGVVGATARESARRSGSRIDRSGSRATARICATARGVGVVRAVESTDPLSIGANRSESPRRRSEIGPDRSGFVAALGESARPLESGPARPRVALDEVASESRVSLHEVQRLRGVLVRQFAPRNSAKAATDTTSSAGPREPAVSSLSSSPRRYPARACCGRRVALLPGLRLVDIVVVHVTSRSCGLGRGSSDYAR